MMVRFSEIINIRDESEKEDVSPETENREDLRWFSDSQIIERGDEITPEISGSTLRDHASVEVVKYFEKCIESAREIRERVIKDQGISPSPILADLHYVIDNELIDFYP